MAESSNLDFARLIGFGGVVDHLSNEVDFRDETIGAKLGGKVGEEPAGEVDFAKLLGFDTVSDQLACGLDLKNSTVSDKLGAKIGPVESSEPAGK